MPIVESVRARPTRNASTFVTPSILTIIQALIFATIAPPMGFILKTMFV